MHIKELALFTYNEKHGNLGTIAFHEEYISLADSTNDSG
jgi:hypothetical protein